MTTYTCKCGKTFGKNTEAGTTGFRMPDYGPAHECYGCPFVCPVLTWDPTTQASAVQNHECRASQRVVYHTEAALSLGDKCVGRIYSLDFDFLRRVREYAESLEGIEPDRYAFSTRPADYCDDGRYKLSIYPSANNKGIAAKQQLFEEFFNPDGTRKDVLPEQEKEIVLQQIQDGKKEMQRPMTQYQHHDKVYLVQECEDGKYRAYFYYLANPANLIAVGDITKCDAAWIAQKILDEYAERRGFEVYGSDTNNEEIAEPEQQTFSDTPDESDETVPSSDDSADMEQVGETLESDNSEADLENGSNDSDNTSCSWQNASGTEQEEEEADENIPAGERVSLNDATFYPLIAACDEKINRALRMAIDAQQGFAVTAKISFEPRGSIFGVKYETGYQFDPIKVKDKGELYEDIQISLDAAGNPIIPYDREHQMTFDEVPPTPPVVTQVDGSTGLVESVAVGEEWEPPTSDDLTNDILKDELDIDPAVKSLYPCNCSDCPFFTVGDDGAEGCYFDGENAEGDSYDGDVWEAVHMHNCQREEVLHVYRMNDPENEVDDVPDDSDELPFEPQEDDKEEYVS